MVKGWDCRMMAPLSAQNCLISSNSLADGKSMPLAHVTPIAADDLPMSRDHVTCSLSTVSQSAVIFL